MVARLWRERDLGASDPLFAAERVEQVEGALVAEERRIAKLARRAIDLADFGLLDEASAGHSYFVSGTRTVETGPILQASQSPFSCIVV